MTEGLARKVADWMLESKAQNVVIIDVAAILAQMCGDAVGPGQHRHLGRLHRIRMPAAARIAHGRDVINVDAETETGESGQGTTLGQRKI